MIVVVEQYNSHKYEHLLDQMFRQRARVFHERLGWDVTVIDGRERDTYDDQAPVYVLYTDDDTRVVKGSLRLLPTTGPTVLADVFSDTLPAGAHLCSPGIWECTRLCIDDRSVKGERDKLHVSLVLVVALAEIAAKVGIRSIVGNLDSSMLRLYRHIGCEVEVLGATGRYGRPVYLGLFPVAEPIIERLRQKLDGPALARSPRETLAA
jgi:acyl homoserine lactone synthase